MPDLGNTSVFSQTDGSNNSGTQPSWSGSAAPSTLDDAGRGLQGAVFREWNWRSFTLTTAGTTTAYTLTYSVAPAAYYNGQRFAAIINATNTGSSTLNVNSLGATTIKKVVAGTLTNLASGDMVAGAYVELAYNTANTCFVWLNYMPVTGTAATYDIGTSGAKVPLLNAANTFSSTGGTSFVATASGSSGAIALKQNSGDTAGGYIQWVDNAVANQKGYIVVNTSSEMLLGTGATERLRITSNGGFAFAGASNYGTSGQFLKSNGDAAPTWATAGGVVALGTITTTSGASQSLTSLTLTGYKFLRLVFNGVSTSSGSVTLSVGSLVVSGSVAAADVNYGQVDIDLTNGVGTGGVGTSAISTRAGATGYSTATTTVTVSVSGGNLDLGTVLVYGIA